MVRQIQTLRLVAKQVNKPFQNLIAKDVERYLITLKERQLSLESIATEKRVLKVFFKWLNGGTYPDCVSWVKVDRCKSTILPDELLSVNDVKKMLESCKNSRERALVSVLWESGGRVGEIGSLLIKNVQFDEYGGQIVVDGKTGMRRVRLVSSTPDLLAWIQDHPLKSNPNAPLWVNLDKHHQSMGYRNMCYKIQEIATKAGISKPVNPHHFRHSRATYLCQFLTEAQMKEYLGWTQDSSAPARYIHLSGKQVDDAILQLNGIKRTETIKQESLFEVCPRCKKSNSTTADLCSSCWLPLKPSAMMEVDSKLKQENEGSKAFLQFMEAVQRDPAKLNALLAFMGVAKT